MVHLKKKQTGYRIKKIITYSLDFVLSNTYLCCCCLEFCPKAGSLFLVYNRRESYFLNTNKARAHLYGGVSDSFQTENSYQVGSDPGISRIEVRVWTTKTQRLLAVAQWFRLYFIFLFYWIKPQLSHLISQVLDIV